MSTLRISEVVRTSKTGTLFRKVARETSGENFDIPDDNKVLFAYEAKDGCNRDLVGVACYMPATHSEGSHHFLNYIFIKPYHQNMGYGAALLKRVESSMLSKARRPIRVESAKRAVGFFRKNGYVCRGEGIECVCGGSPLFSSLQEMEKTQPLGHERRAAHQRVT